ncbi:ABC transporter ATP-binding protein [Enterovirga rhinocerotis]|uniref:Amino acid/amide ABC transporter ATP-binding protein 2 (HAAT family) n=1 Tax=Enterovirga rhinocerotis TaxID=1339210 RepID=A0A4V3DWM1_9HYPH|nr:ABC transporter ATP-binding protein [Enterovirga rhinocerotis]TDR85269.1 amino acid/amide ABC transporter ATP-binding protein 2 (HAAT family) [Enterovirga rhinocerotis]
MRLELQDVSARYGAVVALDRISVVVPSGTTAAIIGANGAGKSTLLGTITGLVPLAGGRILVDGADLAGLPTEQRVRGGIALSPEGRRLFPEMTVGENLLSGAYARRDRRAVAADLERVFALFPRLLERRGNLGRNLSGGEQQMCAIGRALMAAPRLLLLDEPSLGLAPAVVVDMARAIRAIAATGVTVVLVEQNARLALALAETGHVLEAGRLVRSAPARDLADDPEVQRAYLGELLPADRRASTNGAAICAPVVR